MQRATSPIASLPCCGEARNDYVTFLLALGRFQHRTAFARALVQLDVAPEAVEADPSLSAAMRPIAWSFGDGATFSGFTDDTQWNGYLNVWVTPATWPYVRAELIAGADGDVGLIDQYRRTPEVNGLMSLSHGLTTSEVTPVWLTMFADYPVATMIPIPESWTEESWHNDTAPSFSPCAGPMGEMAQVWIDYEDPAAREIPEANRFSFCRRDAVGELAAIYAGDDYDELVRHVAIEQLACNFARRLGRMLRPDEWREMRLRNRTAGAGVCASHDFVDANMVMLEAWRATRDTAIVGAGDAEQLAGDLDHVNAAWTVATRHYLTSDDDLACCEAMLVEARSGWLYGLDRAFTRAERGALLVEVRNRRHLLAIGRVAPREKGARLDLALLSSDALERLIQSHRDLGLVQQLRAERQRRLTTSLGDDQRCHKGKCCNAEHHQLSRSSVDRLPKVLDHGTATIETRGNLHAELDASRLVPIVIKHVCGIACG